MTIEPGALVVIGLYVVCLWIIWRVSPRLPGAQAELARPWWRNVRVWASLVAAAQIVTYALLS